MRTLIVEADGACRGNPGDASYGAVVRDAATGTALAEVAAVIGRATSHAAGYHGVIAGLDAARAVDPDAVVEVRMDCRLVVEQLSGRWQVRHPAMRPLAERARRSFPAHGRITLRHIPPAQNGHADRLAHAVLDAAARGEVWRPAVPLRGQQPASSADASSTGMPTGAPADAPAPDSAAAPASMLSRSVPSTAPQGTDTPADLAAPTRLILLRHGVTALTGERRFSGIGSGDPELTAAGLAQARAAADRLAGPVGSGAARPGDAVYGRIDAIVASPLRRTRQTAQAVADAAGLDVRIEEGLRELDFGLFEGLTFAEARDRYPRQLAAWLAGTDNPAPDGESIRQVAERAARARDHLVVRFPRRTVLAVTHVTPIKALVCLALRAPLDAAHRMELSPASITVIDLYADGAVNLRVFNDTAHLLATRTG